MQDWSLAAACAITPTSTNFWDPVGYPRSCVKCTYDVVAAGGTRKHVDVERWLSYSWDSQRQWLCNL